VLPRGLFIPGRRLRGRRRISCWASAPPWSERQLHLRLAVGSAGGAQAAVHFLPCAGSGFWSSQEVERGVRLGSLKAVGVSFFVGICGDDGGGELWSPGMELDEMNRLPHLRKKKGFVLILYSVGVFLQKGCTCTGICSFQ